MRKSILLLASFLCVTHFSYGQIPDIPVDLLTGSPNISIPIQNVTEGSLNIPISLFYPGGGVRVEETEGTAGIGWFIQGEGRVTREVRGLPDDYAGTGSDARRGWLYDNLAQTINSFTPFADEDYATCADEAGDYNFLFDLYSELQDTEPDIFSFNAPGLNGRFVLGIDGLPKLIPFQDIKVEVSMNSLGIYAVKITNHLGVVYYFDVMESVTRSSGIGSGTNYFSRISRFYNAPLDFGSVWYLSRITAPDGAEIIFKYESIGDESLSKNHIAIVNEANVTDTLYSIEDKFKARQLSAIETDAMIVNFEWQDGIIKNIHINDRATSEKRSFNFVYGDIKDYRQSASSGLRRAFLKEIYESGNCNAYPSYSFTYDGVNFTDKTTTLPFWSRNYQDLWGFYNGTSADRKPDIYVYNTLSDAERYRITPIPGQAESLHLMGSGRSVSPSLITAGSLKQINYPSGAFASLIYESNDYFDAQANGTYQGGGIRVKQVTIAGGERGSENIVTEYEYTREDGESSGRFLYRPVFAFAVGNQIIRSFNNLAPDRGILYSRTTVKQTGKGKTVYEFLNPATYPSTSELDWGATKNRIARYPKPQEPGEPVPPCVALVY